MKPRSNTYAYDFHCHVDLHPDPPALIQECENKRIVIFAVTTTPLAWSQNMAWTSNSAFVHAAAGLHPELVGERSREADLLEELIGHSRLVGEIGLDGSPQYRPHFDAQKRVFARALSAANRHGERLVSIHSRRAAADVIALVEELTNPERVTCILHWFSGSQAELRRAAAFGCYFSVNAAMLRGDRARRLVKEIPFDRLLTETDAPFVAERGKRIHPRSVVDLVPELAGIHGMEFDEMRDHIAQNSETALSVAGVTLE